MELQILVSLEEALSLIKILRDYKNILKEEEFNIISLSLIFEQAIEQKIFESKEEQELLSTNINNLSN